MSLESIAKAVERAADCPAEHVETVAVVDTFLGQTMWQGTVEVFALSRHPKAKRAYGWMDGNGQNRKYTAVLEIPPVVDALTAVRAAMVAGAKK